MCALTLLLIRPGAAATVERLAAALCDVEAHDAAVERETAALAAAIGDPVSNSSDESKLSIIESFLVLHYMGAHSVKPEGRSSRAAGITGHVVANFFNTIGRTAQHGEFSFPFGGYFNAFKASGMTAAGFRELREIVRTQLCGGRHGVALHGNAVTKHCVSFKMWFTSAEGRASICYKMLEECVVKLLQQWCAAQYRPGGRLEYAQHRSGRAVPSSAEFKVSWLPDAVLHSILYRVLSPHTEKWLKLQPSDAAVRDIAQGFTSENDAITGEVGTYTGNYMLQLGKTLSVALRALNDGTDACETRLARRARFLAVKNATRLRKYRSVAVTDDIFVDAVARLDLRYSWDATLFSAMCDAETLALRRVEVFQQDRGDCKQAPEGECVTLPNSKADQQSAGITRLKKHRNGCQFEGCGLLRHSRDSACKVGSDGELDGRTRCQVCAKRYLQGLQGVRPEGEAVPSFISLTKHAQPSWLDPCRGTPDARVSAPEDFLYGKAMPYEGFAEMFNLLLAPLNRRRLAKGLSQILARNWHWHGLRHGCANNLHLLEPPMSDTQIADWCRMSLWILQYYLKHNRTGADPTNRTNAISGCNTLSLETVAAWCARQNSTVTQARVKVLLGQLGLGSIDNFINCERDDLKEELRRCGFSLGERNVVLEAFGVFSSLLRNGDDVAVDAVISDLSLDAEIDDQYRQASMGRETAELDRRAVFEEED